MYKLFALAVLSLLVVQTYSQCPGKCVCANKSEPIQCTSCLSPFFSFPYEKQIQTEDDCIDCQNEILHRDSKWKSDCICLLGNEPKSNINKCALRSCPPNEWLKIEANKCITCPKGTTKNDQKQKRCHISQTCNDNEIIKPINGQCILCQPGYEPARRLNICVPCKQNYFYNSATKLCEICQKDTTNAAPKQLQCSISNDQCRKNNQIINKDNICQQCDVGYQLSATLNFCEKCLEDEFSNASTEFICHKAVSLQNYFRENQDNVKEIDTLVREISAQIQSTSAITLTTQNNVGLLIKNQQVLGEIRQSINANYELLKKEEEKFSNEDACEGSKVEHIVQRQLNPIKTQLDIASSTILEIFKKLNSSKILVAYGLALWMLMTCVF